MDTRKRRLASRRDRWAAGPRSEPVLLDIQAFSASMRMCVAGRMRSELDQRTSRDASLPVIAPDDKRQFELKAMGVNFACGASIGCDGCMIYPIYADGTLERYAAHR